MGAAQAVPAHRAREYETIYILRPNAGEEAAQKVATRIVETVDRLEGKLIEVDVWGRRRLAYKIKGSAKGVFIYLRYLGYPGLIEELERNLRMLDAVLKYQTVKLIDEIDPATVEVDPEAIKFQGMDFTEEPEEEAPQVAADERKGAEAPFLDYEPEPIATSGEAEGAPKAEKAEEKAAAAEPAAEAAAKEPAAEAAAEEPAAEAAAEEPAAEEPAAEAAAKEPAAEAVAEDGASEDDVEKSKDEEA